MVMLPAATPDARTAVELVEGRDPLTRCDIDDRRANGLDLTRDLEAEGMG
jgi:hypothetical protein